ncbi:hypothetical protein MAR_033966 [Mya arenaria]|uniref:Apolipoprotein L3 n=1 Tax=Mya arenaria TaxID=6604 RepID=A0ABY7GD00_MYAAR|nr:uncharacterized protein LOC128224237 [Mya arenaria]WAR31424.1 hypothetical protein MAR_033966 [Mya arenaria]
MIGNLKELISAKKNIIKQVKAIGREMKIVEQNYRTANIVTKSLSIVSGIISVGLVIAAPFTGGLTGTAAVAVTGLGLAGSSGLLLATFLQQITESGLLQQLQEAIARDQAATKRFKHALRAVREAQSLMRNTATFISSAKRLVKSADVAMDTMPIAKMATKASVFLTKANFVITVVMIPMDLISLVDDLKNQKEGRLMTFAKRVFDILAVLESDCADLEIVENEYNEFFPTTTEEPVLQRVKAEL